MVQIQKVVTDYFKDKPVKKVYLFGSYARGEADENSDVDLLLEITDSALITYHTLGGYLADMNDSFGKKVDILLSGSLRKDRLITRFIEAQKKLLYAKPD
jgi:predicted nucleotidyltransferase